ncbi:AMP_1a_G0000130.mRNA.1.CDS.1 [Saccharomyces cerevisiae]|nr:AMP_1a_G0000130.mRNA.1.CDS.1 [Saccharomyces cerevisiae]CAI6466299.1 AMP_1a_G0000130.mRNA.1.CDS.1 [Saccharomyces cerevisiae]
MLAKTGDVTGTEGAGYPFVRFFFIFFVLPFCLLHRLYMGMKQVPRIYNGTQRFSPFSSSGIARFP